MTIDGVHSYDYPRPAVTVDVVLFLVEGDLWKVLLIRRENEPFSGFWALPGGFVDEMERLEDAARRELFEETGIEAGVLEQLGAWGDPGRDPRGHTISIVFCGLAGATDQGRAGDDASEVRWFRVDGLPELAFDHARIIQDAIDRRIGVEARTPVHPPGPSAVK